jgi:hypothetical protein
MITLTQVRGLPGLLAVLALGIVVFMLLYLYFPAMSVSDYRREVGLSSCPRKNGKLRIACVGYVHLKIYNRQTFVV